VLTHANGSGTVKPAGASGTFKPGDVIEAWVQFTSDLPEGTVVSAAYALETVSDGTGRETTFKLEGRRPDDRTMKLSAKLRFVQPGNYRLKTVTIDLPNRTTTPIESPQGETITVEPYDEPSVPQLERIEILQPII
jgi:hypothetical protein